MIDRTLEAIATIYAGVTFRSALEARWAAFFDAIGIEWQYEPCQLDGWTPDFLVAKAWLAEVKPVPMTSMAIVDEPEAQKAIRSFDTLLLGDGPGDALGVLVRRCGGEVIARYLVADLSQVPPALVLVPRMVPGYNLGLSDIWHGMSRAASPWRSAPAIFSGARMA